MNAIISKCAVLNCASIFIRRTPSHFLEHPAQMMRILEADFVSNFAHGLVRACQQILDAVDNGKVDVFDGGLAGFLLHKVAEIVGGEVELVGTPRHGGQTDLLGLV